MGSSTGRYSDTMLRAATTTAKHTWRSSASGSLADDPEAALEATLSADVAS